MTQLFLVELVAQMRGAADQLREAVGRGDDFLADVLSARLDQLHRVATDHGIRC